MGEYAQEALPLSCCVRPPTQRRPQQPLVPAEGASHLPTLPVDPAVPRPDNLTLLPSIIVNASSDLPKVTLWTARTSTHASTKATVPMC
jgi:hypothetical protein